MAPPGSLRSSRRVGLKQIAAFVLVGFMIGSAIGYVLMATVHAVGDLPQLPSHRGVLARVRLLLHTRSTHPRQVAMSARP